MNCPFCSNPDSKVIDSRLVADGAQIRRRRECTDSGCAERFTSYETTELLLPKIIKKDGRREPFDDTKLVMGIDLAIRKRKVSEDDRYSIIEKIKQKILQYGEREIKSVLVGEIVMEELFRVDAIAFIRFASVYKDFKSAVELEQFSALVSKGIQPQMEDIS